MPSLNRAVTVAAIVCFLSSTFFPFQAPRGIVSLAPIKGERYLRGTPVLFREPPHVRSFNTTDSMPRPNSDCLSKRALTSHKGWGGEGCGRFSAALHYFQKNGKVCRCTQEQGAFRKAPVSRGRERERAFRKQGVRLLFSTLITVVKGKRALKKRSHPPCARSALFTVPGL